MEFRREKCFNILRVNRYIADPTEQLLLQIRAKGVEELLVKGQQTLVGIGIPGLFYQVEREGPSERYLRFHGQTAVMVTKRSLGLRIGN